MGRKKNGKNRGNGKVQGELPGAERPSNSALDAIAKEFLAKKTKLSRATDAFADVRERMRLSMVDLAEALERDKHDNPTYVYTDGEIGQAFHLVNAQKLTVEKLSGAPADTGDEPSEGADAEAF